MQRHRSSLPFGRDKESAYRMAVIPPGFTQSAPRLSRSWERFWLHAHLVWDWSLNWIRRNESTQQPPLTKIWALLWRQRSDHPFEITAASFISWWGRLVLCNMARLIITPLPKKTLRHLKTIHLRINVLPFITLHLVLSSKTNMCFKV